MISLLRFPPFILMLVAINSSCTHVPVRDLMRINSSIDQADPLIINLIERTKEYYAYLEDKEWSKIYDMLSVEFLKGKKHIKEFASKAAFVNYFKNDTYLGICRWEFVSLKIEEFIIRGNRAYIKVEYSTREAYKREPYKPSIWWDEWVFDGGEWKISRFVSGKKPNILFEE